MINRAVLTGRLTKDAELRTTQNGLSVATFTLAVNRQYSMAKGDANFINCVIWRKAAENFCNFTSKGSLVGIDGRIQTRNYENQNGQKVYVTEIVVDSFSLLESKKDRLANNNNGNNSNYDANTNNNGFSNTTTNTNYISNSSNDSKAPDPFAESGDSIDITDDDLPF